MATRIKQTDVASEGAINFGDQAELQFVVLHTGLTLITEESLFEFLGIDDERKLIASDLLPARIRTSYHDLKNHKHFGLAIPAIPAFCISIIEANYQANNLQSQSMNAAMLITLLCSCQLNDLVQAAGFKARQNPARTMRVRWKKQC